MPDNPICENELIEAVKRSVNQRPGRMIQLASLLSSQASLPVQYGNDYAVSTTESGLLFYIANNPGVTNAELARQFGRTKGAISQIVKRLETSGYIVKEQSARDAKSFNLYVTVPGGKLIHAINDYDSNNENSMFQKLVRNCSVEDIQTFYRMVDTYISLLIPTASSSRQPVQEEAETDDA